MPTDSDAVDAWVRANLARAVAYARSLVRDLPTAEDVVHDSFARLLAKADQYDLPRDGTRLLFRSITNAAINRTTRAKDWLPLGPGNGEYEAADKRTLEPLAILLDRELAVSVAEGLAKLSITQRAALEMRSLGFGLQEVGEALGTTPGNAGVIVHRARQLLAGHLSASNEDHEA
ncbi:MAG: sigma-70 family RNA polymerase sigma factor [Gemmataceae bacterium]